MNKQDKKGIGWCDYTWNPVTGCLHGCEYCYADRIANRFASKVYTQNKINFAKDFKTDLHIPYKNNAGKIEPYPAGFQPTFHRYRLDEPKQKKKPLKIFVSSMGDLFGTWVPDTWITEVMKAISKAPQHTYIFLTKNPDRYYEYFEGAWQDIPEEYDLSKVKMLLGTSVTTQDDLKKLGVTRGMIDFLSIEPLLAEVDIEDSIYENNGYAEWSMKWVIVGAQTGPGAVAPKTEWVQSIIDQCRSAGVPIFLKDNLNWQEKIQEYPK